MQSMTAKEAKELLDAGDARLIDVRERQEWDEIRVPGSELVPLSEYEADHTRVPASDGPTIFICASGSRSQAAAAIYEDVWDGVEGINLTGGINSWAARAFPIEIGPRQG
jgi:rhodanese-related sulfurtransferase